MLFNTIDFVVFFIVVLTIISIIKNRKFEHLFILGASYFFFFYSSNYLIILLVASTLLDFYVGKEIYVSDNPRKKKALLIMTLVGNLGLLGFFKYADFGIEQFNNLAYNLGIASNIPLLNLVLPIGISFYTFQTLSYSIDIYRGNLIPSKSLKEFAIFVAFFPTLVAGPIIRAKDFLPQLRDKIESSGGYKLKQFLIQERNLKFGISLMAIGFFKKMFFADNIAPLVNDIFETPIGQESFTIILATIGFGIQIYADFSGYSDIAIGAAMIIGITVKANFNKPFFAKSPSDFWNRWHISLSSWVRDYMYIPMVFKRRKSLLTIFFSMIFTMTVIGFWSKFGIIFSILVTQYLMFFAFISFRVRDLADMTYSMQKYVFWDLATEKTIEVIMGHKFEVSLIVIFFILHFISYRKTNLPEKISKYPLITWSFFIFGIITLILFFYDTNPQDFIYFRF